MTFYLPFGCCAAALLVSSQPYQYRIFSNTFDLAPRDNYFGGFADSPHVPLSRNNDRADSAILDIDLNIANTSKIFTRAKIDHVLFGKL